MTANDSTDTRDRDDIGWNVVSGVGRCNCCTEPLRFVPCTNCGYPNRDVEVADE